MFLDVHALVGPDRALDTGPVSAQNFPSKVIRIVTAEAGGGGDQVA